jgi:hypothetical protein
MPPSFSSCMVPLPLSSSRLRTRHPFDNTDNTDNTDEADKPTFAMCRRGQQQCKGLLDPGSF